MPYFYLFSFKLFVSVQGKTMTIERAIFLKIAQIFSRTIRSIEISDQNDLPTSLMIACRAILIAQ